jgi:hypothetical protein
MGPSSPYYQPGRRKNDFTLDNFIRDRALLADDGLSLPY